MRKFKIKCISSLCLCFMFMSLFTMPCSANEIYYDGSTGINLKWGEIVNGKALLRINGDYLDSNYSPHFSVISSAWNNVASKVTTVQSSFTSSTVDMATASETYWTQRWKNEARKQNSLTRSFSVKLSHLLGNLPMRKVLPYLVLIYEKRSH